LTGFFVPLEASEAQKRDETAQDDFDFAVRDGEGTDDDVTPEPPPPVAYFRRRSA
jgi:hypothetical protein